MKTDESSSITSPIIEMLYPFIILFGFYIISNGHKTPGGGFQGGAVLSAVFITRYLAIQVNDIKMNTLQAIEKILFISIITVPLIFLFANMNFNRDFLNEYYLIFMNAAIGIKVWCGLSIIFFRFVFYESL